MSKKFKSDIIKVGDLTFTTREHCASSDYFCVEYDCFKISKQISRDGWCTKYQASHGAFYGTADFKPEVAIEHLGRALRSYATKLLLAAEILDGNYEVSE